MSGTASAIAIGYGALPRKFAVKMLPISLLAEFQQNKVRNVQKRLH